MLQAVNESSELNPIQRQKLMSHNSRRFPTRSDTNRPVQSQKKARSLKFRIEQEEGLYYLSSENKDADRLCGYCTADLRLCFCIYRKSGFSIRRLKY